MQELKLILAESDSASLVLRGVESGGAVENLPCHTFPSDDGGVDMKCPTEIAISDRREAELAKNGFMPLVHRKNSDVAAFIGYTKQAVELDQDQIVTITPTSHTVMNFDGTPAEGKPYEVTWDAAAAEKGGYDTFMEKEINDQPHAVGDTLLGRTDAEGRLVMADALARAVEEDPDAVLDVATLTGACVVALGPHIFGVMGNDEELRTAILEASPAKSKAALQAHLDDAVQRIVAKRG